MLDPRIREDDIVGVDVMNEKKKKQKARMSWPNRITLGRILLTGPFIIAMLHVENEAYQPWPRYIAIGLFVAMSISDGLDGWLARRNHWVTSLGAFLDPLADKLLISASCLILSLESTAIKGMVLPRTVAVLVIGKDLYMVVGFMIIYMITSRVKIVPLKTGKFSTMIQLSMVLSILVWPDMEGVFGAFRYVIWCLWWLAGGMAVLSILMYTREGTRRLNEFEQMQKEAAGSDSTD